MRPSSSSLGPRRAGLLAASVAVVIALALWFGSSGQPGNGAAAVEPSATAGPQAQPAEASTRLPAPSADLPAAKSAEPEAEVRRSTAATTLASGTVKSFLGQPVPHARVKAMAHLPPDPNDPKKSRWRLLSSAQCDEHGRFELVGSRAPERLFVYASHKGFVDNRRQLEAGSENVALRLYRGAIEGRVLTAPFVNLHRVVVVAAPLGGAARLDHVHQVPVRKKGLFCFKALPVGRYRLEFRHARFKGSLLILDDIEVGRLGYSNDHRLKRVDLTECLAHRKIDIVDEQGRAVKRGELTFVKTGEPFKNPLKVHIRGGRAGFDVPGEGIDLQISAKGRRTRVLHGVTSDTRVDLVSSRSPKLELEAGLRLEGYQLVLYIKHDAAPPALGPQRFAFVGGKSREIAPEFPVPGRWSFSWWLVGQPEKSGPGGSIYRYNERVRAEFGEREGRDYVEVGAFDEGRTVPIGPDRAELARLLQLARAR